MRLAVRKTISRVRRDSNLNYDSWKLLFKKSLFAPQLHSRVCLCGSAGSNNNDGIMSVHSNCQINALMSRFTVPEALTFRNSKVKRRAAGNFGVKATRFQRNLCNFLQLKSAHHFYPRRGKTCVNITKMCFHSHAPNNPDSIIPLSENDGTWRISIWFSI